MKKVFLAPVPAEHLKSWWESPKRAERVAFGTDKEPTPEWQFGMEVYIKGSRSEDPRDQKVRWHGHLGNIVPAVEYGPRSGKHENPHHRPPSAEETDGAFLRFWEVIELRPLGDGIPLSKFRSKRGGKPYPGDTLEWPVIAYHSDEP